MLFSVNVAASAIIDFSRKNMNNGVVESPPSRGPWRSPILLASPLEDSHCIGGRHHSPSPRPPSSRTPHRQLYKRCMDDVLGNAFVHSHVQCSSAPGRIFVHAIHPRCTMMDHLRVKDNLFATLPVAIISLRSIIEIKDVGGGGDRPCIEDIV